MSDFPGGSASPWRASPEWSCSGVVILGTYLYSSHRVLKELKAVRAAGQQNG